MLTKNEASLIITLAGILWIAYVSGDDTKGERQSALGAIQKEVMSTAALVE